MEKIDTNDCKVINISLICSEDALRRRLTKDVLMGLRTEDVIQRSIARLKLYDELDTIKIDTSALDYNEVAEKILKL